MVEHSLHPQPTAWCLDQRVHPQGMQSRGPHCWPQRQWSSPPTSAGTLTTAPDLPTETACPLGLSPSLADWPPPGWSRGVVFSSTSVLHPPGTLPLGKCPWTPQSRHQGLETSPHSSLTEERHPASPLPQGTPKGDGKGVGRGGHRPFRGNRDQDAGGVCERGRPAGEAGGLGQAGP